jgi:heme exporter protein A
LTAALTLNGVNRVRGERALFSGLDLQLPGGQLLCVAGANGAGKTSLLSMVCGLLATSSGEVHWRGGPLAAQPKRWGR